MDTLVQLAKFYRWGFTVHPRLIFDLARADYTYLERMSRSGKDAFSFLINTIKAYTGKRHANYLKT
jgi:hypothetical protein